MQRLKIQGTCLIFIAPELWYYHGCMWSYARQWAKKEDVELDTLSELIKSIDEVVKRRIRRLKYFVNTRSESIFRDLMLSVSFPVSMRILL